MSQNDNIGNILNFPGSIPSYGSGGGSGGPGDMEQRVAKLEASVEYMGRDVHEIRHDMVTKEHLESVLNRRALKAAGAVLIAIVASLTWLAQVYLSPILERLSAG